MVKLMYEIIKKQNGEAFAKTIQKKDERIFSIPDLKWILRYAGRNPLPIFPLLRYMADEQNGKKTSNKDPIELLKEAGYEAFYVETEDQKKSIKKYLAPNEEMHAVWFKDYLKYYHVIYAVKKGADQLKREDFKNPYYDDEYAQSVISIQISKEDNKLFIENRYAGYGPTYNLNPDNIIAGLSDALEKKFNKKLSPMKQLMPKFFLHPDERLIHYYFERNGVSQKDVVKLGIDICTALELFYNHNITHNDIKPGNIFIDQAGNPAITSFAAGSMDGIYWGEDDSHFNYVGFSNHTELLYHGKKYEQ